MGPFNFGPETPEEKEERSKNPFYGDTPKLAFVNDAQRQKQADDFYQVPIFFWWYELETLSFFLFLIR